MTKIAFIGAGNLASAMIRGLIKQGVPPKDLLACNPSSEKLTALQHECGIQISTDNLTVVDFAEVVVLSVKPAMIPIVCQQLQGKLDSQLIISVAAGVRLESLEKAFLNLPIVRVMPNVGAQCGLSASSCISNSTCQEKQRQQVEELLTAIGSVTWLPEEKLMDVATAIAGSGPAYFFYILKAMRGVAIELGLSDAQAEQLIMQTYLGAGRLAMDNFQNLNALQASVTSKGGTTAAAVNVFTNKHLDDIIATAIRAARDRAVELSQQNAGEAE